MTVIDRIEQLLQSDDEDRVKQSRYLADAYINADKAGQAALDDAFIALCGYSLNTLLNDHPDEED